MTIDTKPLSERPIPHEFMERAAALRNAVVWQSNASNEVIARALMAEHEAKGAQIAELRALADRLKLEAQIHAGEARTANSTIYEIYQVLSGGKGEPGNWHGAEPAKAYVAAAESRLSEQAKLIGEAREVLKPFADAAAQLDRPAAERATTVLQDTYEPRRGWIVMGQLRRAHSLLSKLTEATKP